MNIRKQDIAVNRNYAGYWVLSTMHNGYFRKHVCDGTLKQARADFINLLKSEK